MTQHYNLPAKAQQFFRIAGSVLDLYSTGRIDEERFAHSAAVYSKVLHAICGGIDDLNDMLSHWNAEQVAACDARSKQAIENGGPMEAYEVTFRCEDCEGHWVIDYACQNEGWIRDLSESCPYCKAGGMHPESWFNLKS